MLEMGLAKVYPCTEFEVSSFTRSKDTAHMPSNGWMCEGVCPKSRVDLRRFLPENEGPHRISKMQYHDVSEKGLKMSRYQKRVLKAAQQY